MFFGSRRFGHEPSAPQPGRVDDPSRGLLHLPPAVNITEMLLTFEESVEGEARFAPLREAALEPGP